MLCFLFAALVVALDQFFKHWIVRTLEVGETGQELIPGILGLTRWENDGAMLNILSGQQWLLAGIAFGAAIVLIMILLRYNEGFWGTLGLAAVLGGTIGNLFDRVFNDGKVVDMFRTLFISFPIFNIADIFITMGFLIFLIHFIALSFGDGRIEDAAGDYMDDDYPDEQGTQDETAYDEFPDINTIVSSQAEQEVAAPPVQPSYNPQYAPESQYSQERQQPPARQYPPEPMPEPVMYAPEDVMPMSSDYEPITDTTPELSFSLDDLTAEFESLGDYDVDDLLREYGFDDDNNNV